MKEYKFDYIKEQVDRWSPDIEKTVERIEFLPFYVTLPWIMPDEYRPAMDYYGEVIEDFEDWHRQRHEYCVKLAKEYEILQNEGK